MRPALTIAVSLLLLPAFGQAQNTNDEIHLRATVQSVVPLTSFSGQQVTPVDVDPRFALTVHVESVVPDVPNFPEGAVVTLVIHSPARLFAGEPTKGKTYNFSVRRTFENQKVRFLGLAQEPVSGRKSYGYKPKGGYVPDSQTAVKIAEAVLIPAYGEKQIRSEEPFTAQLEGDVWTIGGTLRCPDGKGGFTTDCDGGTAVIKLSKSDGRILFMMHYK